MDFACNPWKSREKEVFIPRNIALGHDLPLIFAANGAYVFIIGNGNEVERPMTDKNTKAEGQKQAPQHEQAGLQQRYGTIGIEAVAAACRYSNQGKKPAEPASAPRIDQRFEQTN